MATSRPFAFNTGSTISGTEQLGDLAIGVDDIDYDGGVGGVIWWMGPDEDLGYIICRPNFSGTQPNPVGSAAYVRFLRSKLKTEESFVNLVNTVYGQSFTTGDECKTYLNNNGFWTSWISTVPSPTPTNTPTLTPTNTVTPTPTVTPTNSVTPTPTVTPTSTVTPTITPTNTVTPTITPTITITPSITPSTSIGVTFSQTFINNAAPTTSVENAWTTFRSQLTGSYSTMTLSNSLGTTLTVNDPLVQNIANALRTGTTGTNFSVVIGSRTWRVLHGCVAGTPDANSIYLTSSGPCDCGGGTTYTIRPMIKNLNWGGLNGSACNQPTQTLTVTFS